MRKLLEQALDLKQDRQQSSQGRPKQLETFAWDSAALSTGTTELSFEEVTPFLTIWYVRNITV